MLSVEIGETASTAKRTRRWIRSISITTILVTCQKLQLLLFEDEWDEDRLFSDSLPEPLNCTKAQTKIYLRHTRWMRLSLRLWITNLMLSVEVDEKLGARLQRWELLLHYLSYTKPLGRLALFLRTLPPKFALGLKTVGVRIFGRQAILEGTHNYYCHDGIVLLT